MKRLPKIIIADDMQMMRRLLKTALMKAGFDDITEAMNGEELLKKLDEVAYIRFASVYRSFQGVDDFTDVIKEVRKPSRK